MQLLLNCVGLHCPSFLRKSLALCAPSSLPELTIFWSAVDINMVGSGNEDWTANAEEEGGGGAVLSVKL